MWLCVFNTLLAQACQLISTGKIRQHFFWSALITTRHLLGDNIMHRTGSIRHIKTCRASGAPDASEESSRASAIPYTLRGSAPHELRRAAGGAIVLRRGMKTSVYRLHGWLTMRLTCDRAFTGYRLKRTAKHIDPPSDAIGRCAVRHRFQYRRRRCPCGGAMI